LFAAHSILAQSVTYSYDSAGRLVKADYGSAGVVTYTYDKAGHLISRAAPVPVLAIAKTHTGNFAQGQNGAAYTATVSNAGGGATSGTVTVTETVPSGLTLASMAGTGWTCPSGGTTCTRSDALAAGASYPPITVTVNVAANATSPQVNAVSVSGGGSASANATDSTTVTMAVTYGISGTVTLNGSGLGGVTMTLSGSASGTTTTSASGTYSLTGLASGGNYTVAPTLSGYVFTPASATFNSISANQTANFIASSSGATPQYVISTIAGTGTQGYSGDGGPSSIAQLAFPWGIALDSAGNLYIADVYNQRVRKVAVNGTISTVAGNGSAGYSGDGGQATSAQLNQPFDVAVDAAGNLYVADSANHRVRKVAANGTISTVAGTGTAGYSGDGGLATSAQLNGPDGLTVDAAGNLYIAEYANNSVRKVAPNGVISTFAGNGTLGYSGDGGAATSAQLNAPHGMAASPGGSLYIADSNNSVVRVVASNGTISTVNVSVFRPCGVALDTAGNLYIANTYAQTVLKLTSGGVVTTVAGDGISGFSGDGGPATSAALNFPSEVAVDARGNFYISDTNSQRVRLVQSVGAAPVLSVSKSHVGNFTQGQTGAAYAVAVNNAAAAGPTSGTVTVTETVPSGLTLASMAGAGWTCPGGGTTCTRTDALAAGSSYPPIAVTVNVASNAPSRVTNQVSVSGGGSAGATASDPTTVLPATMRIVCSPTVLSFAFTIGGASPPIETCTITTSPSGLSLAATASGGPWLSATLSSQTSPATLTVSVNATGLTSGAYGGNITVSSPGLSSESLAVTLTVNPAVSLGIVKTHSGNFTQGQTGGAYTVTVSNAAGGGATSGTVTVTETVPSGLTLASMAGTGWTCPSGGAACTRSDALAAGASYPAITVTVNVAASASSPQINQVSVNGGGSVSASATDSTTITTTQTGHPAFFAGEDALANGVYYLQFPNGTVFGYYGYLSSGWVFHFDMGYEYVNTTSSGSEVYLWDLTSGHWLYTSTSLFPYLYDFTLKTWLYYFPNAQSAGHYTTNPRYFLNTTTGQIFTM
jgi:uncharacterized repeat protein (TIGR01451 family)